MLLSAILPAFRDARTPFIVGSLWVAVVVLAAYPSIDRLQGVDAIESARTLWSELPVAARTATVAFVVYLTGLVGLRWAEQATLAAPAIIFRGAQARSQKAMALVRSAVQARLRPISDTVADVVPDALVLDEFDLAGMRLSREAPEQYQQYDRLRAEGDLRVGVSIPVGAIGGTFAAMLPPIPGAITGVASVLLMHFLFSQGLRYRQEADELLAAAIYFGYTSTPILESLTSNAAADLKPALKRSQAEDFAWFCDFLHARGLLGRYNEFLSKLRHPSGTTRTLADEGAPAMKPATRAALERLLAGDSDRHPSGRVVGAPARSDAERQLSDSSATRQTE